MRKKRLLKRAIAVAMASAMVLTGVNFCPGGTPEARAATDLALKDVLKLSFDGTSGSGTYTENGNEFTLKGAASVVSNPDDSSDKVLAVNQNLSSTDETKGTDKDWIASAAGILSNNDFSGGVVISMDVRPTVQKTDWNYLFCIGHGADLKNAGIECAEAFSYVDGTIGFITRSGDPYAARFPADGWQAGNNVNSAYNYYMQADNCNKWYNLKYVYTQDYTAIYVDGVLATKWATGVSADILNELTNDVLVLGGGVDPALEHFTGYIDDVTISVAKSPVESISLQSSATLSLENSLDLTAELVPSYANYDTELTWTSADDNIATVTNGKITAKAVGKTTITAETAGGISATCEVTVVDKEVPITSVTATADKSTLNLKETAKITTTYAPEDATGNTSVTFTSSDKNVVNVDNAGVVTALSAGTATITASIGNVKSDPISFTVNDTVSVSGAYAADWTPGYKIVDGTMLQFQLSDLKGGDSIWSNILADFSSVSTNGFSAPDTVDGYTQYARIRGDNYDLHAGTKVTFDGGVPDVGDAAFIAMMKDAEGTITISRTGENITYCFEITGKDETVCTRTAKLPIDGLQDLYVAFSVDSSSYTISKVHTWTANSYSTETTAPTCSEKGYTTYTDGGKTVKADWVSAKGHKLTKHNAVDTTCTTAGKKEYWTCANEDGILYADAEGKTKTSEDDLVIPAPGHKMTKTEAKEATCTEAGNIEYYTCSECEKYFTDEAGKNEITLESTIKAKIPHKLEHHAAVEANCITQTNGTIEYWECTLCGTKFNVGENPASENIVSDIEVPYTHNLTKVDKVDPSCAEEKDGNKEHYKCNDCGKLFEDAEGTTAIEAEDTVIPYAHTWVIDEEKTTATCVSPGYVTQTCSVCQKHEDGKEVDKLGHSYDKGVATKEATCTEDGILTKTCQRKTCTADTEGHVITEVIPAKGHNLVKTEAKEATESAEGNIEYYTCSECQKCFGDAKGANEITPESTIIPKKTVTGNNEQPTPPAQDNGGQSTAPAQDSGSTATTSSNSTAVKKGATATDSKTGGSYKVTTAGTSSKAAVEYVKPTGKAAKATTITIPATVKVNGITCKVTSIKASAFANNKKVKTITVGKNITKIGKKAFYNCKKIKTIKIKTTKLTKKNLGKNAFKGINKKVIIKVPKSKLKAYKKLFRSKGLSKKVKIVKL